MHANRSVSEKVAVFVGPSLSTAEVHQRIAKAIIKPPARKGSVFELIGKGIDKAVVIDGLFYNSPSLWHREILAAMDSGIRVYGASSIGALRAAELAPYGMTGFGWIYDRYIDGSIDGDDEVSLLHESEQNGYRNLSIPLVNLRFNLENARKEGIIDEDEAARIIKAFKSKAFYDRTINLFLEEPDLNMIKPIRDGSLTRLFKSNWIDIKALDARLALSAANSDSNTTSKGVQQSYGRELRPDYVISAIKEHIPRHRKDYNLLRQSEIKTKEMTAGIACAIAHFSTMISCRIPNTDATHEETNSMHKHSTSAQKMLSELEDQIELLVEQTGIKDTCFQITVPDTTPKNRIEIDGMLILLIGWLLELNQCEPSHVERLPISNYVESLNLEGYLKTSSIHDRIVCGIWLCEKTPDYFGLSSWRDPVFSDIAMGIQAARNGNTA